MYRACIYKYFQIAAESFPRKQIFSTHSDYRKDRKKKIVKRGTCSSCVHFLNAEETTSRSESNQIKSHFSLWLQIVEKLFLISLSLLPWASSLHIPFPPIAVDSTRNTLSFSSTQHSGTKETDSFYLAGSAMRACFSAK